MFKKTALFWKEGFPNVTFEFSSCALPSQPLPCPSMQNANLDVPHLSRACEEYLYEWFLLKEALSWLFCIQTQTTGHFGEPVLSHQTAADQFPSQLCTHLNQPTSLPNQFPNSTPATLLTRTTCFLLFAPVCYLCSLVSQPNCLFFAVCCSACNSKNPLYILMTSVWNPASHQ